MKTEKMTMQELFDMFFSNDEQTNAAVFVELCRRNRDAMQKWEDDFYRNKEKPISEYFKQ